VWGGNPPFVIDTKGILHLVSYFSVGVPTAIAVMKKWHFKACLYNKMVFPTVRHRVNKMKSKRELFCCKLLSNINILWYSITKTIFIYDNLVLIIYFSFFYLNTKMFNKEIFFSHHDNMLSIEWKHILSHLGQWRYSSSFRNANI